MCASMYIRSDSTVGNCAKVSRCSGLPAVLDTDATTSVPSSCYYETAQQCTSYNKTVGVNLVIIFLSLCLFFIAIESLTLDANIILHDYLKYGGNVFLK